VAFIAVSVWMMYWAAHGRPVECLLGILTVALGSILHVFLAHPGRTGSASPR
jgi:hypothetical protein